eukprot:TRINITY_DN20789_c0_g1_i1.p1 TRINITY_DN20789_c0_g1~~TRINITY_DN20789_c0_g1_i1.p1  ORF type:complete len:5468 (+),score=1663.28 TRINITY_DN20789_c0_g1_i1:99-16502(+)
MPPRPAPRGGRAGGGPAEQPPQEADSSTWQRQVEGLSDEAGDRPEASNEALAELRQALGTFYAAIYDESIDRPSAAEGPDESWPLQQKALQEACADIKRRCAARVVPPKPEKGTPPSQIHAWDWMARLPAEWREAFPEDEDPFVECDVFDTELRRLGMSFPVPFLNDKCCFLDGPSWAAQKPECSACQKPKWQIRFSGVLESCRTVLERCLDQLSAVAQTKHKWDPSKEEGLLARDTNTLRWQRRLLQATPDDAVQGIVATFIYAYDLKAAHKEGCKGHEKNTVPEGTCGKHGPPPHVCHGCGGAKTKNKQIYAVMNRASREYGDPAARERLSVDACEAARKTLVIFGPLLWRCDAFLRTLGRTDRMVYRGITIRISKKYTSRTLVPWPSLSSTSSSLAAAMSFMNNRGSLFIIESRTAADICFCSVFLNEAEYLYHTGTILEVGMKLNETLLAMIQCNFDIVFLAEREPGEKELDPHQLVDLRMRTIRESMVVMEDFLKRFVEPRVRVYRAADWQKRQDADTDEERDQFPPKAEGPIFDVFDQWRVQDRVPPALFLAPGGYGKTTVTLVLTARLVSLLGAESEEASQQRKEATQKALQHFDIDGDGMLTRDELKAGLLKIDGLADGVLETEGLMDEIAREAKADGPIGVRMEAFSEEWGTRYKPTGSGAEPDSLYPLWMSLPSLAEEVNDKMAMDRHYMDEFHLDSDAHQAELRGRRNLCFGDSIDEMRFDLRTLGKFKHTMRKRRGQREEHVAELRKAKGSAGFMKMLGADAGALLRLATLLVLGICHELSPQKEEKGKEKAKKAGGDQLPLLGLKDISSELHGRLSNGPLHIHQSHFVLPRKKREKEKEEGEAEPEPEIKQGDLALWKGQKDMQDLVEATRMKIVSWPGGVAVDETVRALLNARLPEHKAKGPATGNEPETAPPVCPTELSVEAWAQPVFAVRETFGERLLCFLAHVCHLYGKRLRFAAAVYEDAAKILECPLGLAPLSQEEFVREVCARHGVEVSEIDERVRMTRKFHEESATLRMSREVLQKMEKGIARLTAAAGTLRAASERVTQVNDVLRTALRGDEMDGQSYLGWVGRSLSRVREGEVTSTLSLHSESKWFAEQPSCLAEYWGIRQPSERDATLFHWPRSLLILSCRPEWLVDNQLYPADVVGDDGDVWEVCPFQRPDVERYVRQAVKTLTLFGTRPDGGITVDRLCYEAVTRAGIRHKLRRLWDQPAEGEGQGKQSGGGTWATKSLLQVPFLTSMAVEVVEPHKDGSNDLEAVENTLCMEPSPGRWEVYEAWLRHHVKRRLPLVQSELKGKGEWDDTKGLEYLMRVGYALFSAEGAGTQWAHTKIRVLRQMDVAKSMGCPEDAVALVELLPLRVHSYEDEDAEASFRQKTIHEFLIARGIISLPHEDQSCLERKGGLCAERNMLLLLADRLARWQNGPLPQHSAPYATLSAAVANGAAGVLEQVAWHLEKISRFGAGEHGAGRMIKAQEWDAAVSAALLGAVAVASIAAIAGAGPKRRVAAADPVSAVNCELMVRVMVSEGYDWMLPHSAKVRWEKVGRHRSYPCVVMRRYRLDGEWPARALECMPASSGAEASVAVGGGIMCGFTVALEGEAVRLYGDARNFGGRTEWKVGDQDVPSRPISVSAGWRHFAVVFADGTAAYCGELQYASDGEYNGPKDTAQLRLFKRGAQGTGALLRAGAEGEPVKEIRTVACGLGYCVLLLRDESIVQVVSDVVTGDTAKTGDSNAKGGDTTQTEEAGADGGAQNITKGPPLTDADGTPHHFVAIDAGTHHAIALTRTGKVVVWGKAGDGAAEIAGRRALAVAAGHGHCAAAMHDGAVAVWGSNTCGQADMEAAQQALKGRCAVAVACGFDFTLALTDTNEVVAWGSSAFGQAEGWANLRIPQRLVAEHGAVELGRGSCALHCAARLSKGYLAAWGKDDKGQCRTGGRPPQFAPRTSVSLPPTDAGEQGNWAGSPAASRARQQRQAAEEGGAEAAAAAGEVATVPDEKAVPDKKAEKAPEAVGYAWNWEKRPEAGRKWLGIQVVKKFPPRGAAPFLLKGEGLEGQWVASRDESNAWCKTRRLWRAAPKPDPGAHCKLLTASAEEADELRGLLILEQKAAREKARPAQHPELDEHMRMTEVRWLLGLRYNRAGGTKLPKPLKGFVRSPVPDRWRQHKNAAAQHLAWLSAMSEAEGELRLLADPEWAPKQFGCGRGPIFGRCGQRCPQPPPLTLSGLEDDAAILRNGYAPMHVAAQDGRADLIRDLRDLSWAVDPEDYFCRTPLHLACATVGAIAAVRELIGSKADTGRSDHLGLTPLLWAIRRRHWDAVSALLEAQKSDRAYLGLGAPNIHGHTAMHYAAMAGRPELCAAIAEAEAADCKRAAQLDARTTRHLPELLPIRPKEPLKKGKGWKYTHRRRKQRKLLVKLQEAWQNRREAVPSPAVVAAAGCKWAVVNWFLDSRPCPADDAVAIAAAALHAVQGGVGDAAQSRAVALRAADKSQGAALWRLGRALATEGAAAALGVLAPRLQPHGGGEASLLLAVAARHRRAQCAQLCISELKAAVSVSSGVHPLVWAVAAASGAAEPKVLELLIPAAKEAGTVDTPGLPDELALRQDEDVAEVACPALRAAAASLQPDAVERLVAAGAGAGPAGASVLYACLLAAPPHPERAVTWWTRMGDAHIEKNADRFFDDLGDEADPAYRSLAAEEHDAISARVISPAGAADTSRALTWVYDWRGRLPQSMARSNVAGRAAAAERICGLLLQQGAERGWHGARDAGDALLLAAAKGYLTVAENMITALVHSRELPQALARSAPGPWVEHWLAGAGRVGALRTCLDKRQSPLPGPSPERGAAENRVAGSQSERRVAYSVPRLKVCGSAADWAIAWGQPEALALLLAHRNGTLPGAQLLQRHMWRTAPIRAVAHTSGAPFRKELHGRCGRTRALALTACGVEKELGAAALHGAMALGDAGSAELLLAAGAQWPPAVPVKQAGGAVGSLWLASAAGAPEAARLATQAPIDGCSPLPSVTLLRDAELLKMALGAKGALVGGSERLFVLRPTVQAEIPGRPFAASAYPHMAVTLRSAHGAPHRLSQRQGGLPIVSRCTPLAAAVVMGWEEGVEALLAAGAPSGSSGSIGVLGFSSEDAVKFNEVDLCVACSPFLGLGSGAERESLQERILGCLTATGHTPTDAPSLVHAAAAKGNWRAVAALSQKAAAGSLGLTAAFRNQDLSDLAEGWRRPSKVVEALSEEHPLCFAAKGGQVDVLRALIARHCGGKTPTGGVAKDARGRSPLYIAAAKGHAPMVSALLDTAADKKAECAVRSARGLTPLMAAAGAGAVEALKVLLDVGASPCDTVTAAEVAASRGIATGHNVLSCVASGTGSVAVLELLKERGGQGQLGEWLRRGNGADAVDPVPAAAMRGNDAAAFWLLKARDAEQQPDASRLLLAAAEGGCAELLAHAARSGGKATATIDMKFSPLEAGWAAGRLNILPSLLDLATQERAGPLSMGSQRVYIRTSPADTLNELLRLSTRYHFPGLFRMRMEYHMNARPTCKPRPLRHAKGSPFILFDAGYKPTETAHTLGAVTEHHGAGERFARVWIPDLKKPGRHRYGRQRAAERHRRRSSEEVNLRRMSSELTLGKAVNFEECPQLLDDWAHLCEVSRIHACRRLDRLSAPELDRFLKRPQQDRYAACNAEHGAAPLSGAELCAGGAPGLAPEGSPHDLALAQMAQAGTLDPAQTPHLLRAAAIRGLWKAATAIAKSAPKGQLKVCDNVSSEEGWPRLQALVEPWRPSGRLYCMPPLCAASKAGAAQTVEVLLSNHCTDDSGGVWEAVRILRKRQGRVLVAEPQTSFLTALHLAVRYGRTDCVKLLLGHPVGRAALTASDLGSQSGQGQTPLIVAARMGNVAAAEALLAAGAAAERGDPVAACAAGTGSAEILRLLEQKGGARVTGFIADGSGGDSHLQDPVLVAARRGNGSAALWLLQKRTPQKRPERQEVLRAAAEGGCKELAAETLSASDGVGPAPMVTRDPRGHPGDLLQPLELAWALGHLATLPVLLDAAQRECKGSDDAPAVLRMLRPDGPWFRGDKAVDGDIGLPDPKAKDGPPAEDDDDGDDWDPLFYYQIRRFTVPGLFHAALERSTNTGERPALCSALANREQLRRDGGWWGVHYITGPVVEAAKAAGLYPPRQVMYWACRFGTVPVAALLGLRPFSPPELALLVEDAVRPELSEGRNTGARAAWSLAAAAEFAKAIPADAAGAAAVAERGGDKTRLSLLHRCSIAGAAAAAEALVNVLRADGAVLQAVLSERCIVVADNQDVPSEVESGIAPGSDSSALECALLCGAVGIARAIAAALPDQAKIEEAQKAVTELYQLEFENLPPAAAITAAAPSGAAVQYFAAAGKKLKWHPGGRLSPYDSMHAAAARLGVRLQLGAAELAAAAASGCCAPEGGQGPAFDFSAVPTEAMHAVLPAVVHGRYSRLRPPGDAGGCWVTLQRKAGERRCILRCRESGKQVRKVVVRAGEKEGVDVSPQPDGVIVTDTFRLDKDKDKGVAVAAELGECLTALPEHLCLVRAKVSAGRAPSLSPAVVGWLPDMRSDTSWTSAWRDCGHVDSDDEEKEKKKGAFDGSVELWRIEREWNSWAEKPAAELLGDTGPAQAGLEAFVDGLTGGETLVLPPLVWEKRLALRAWLGRVHPGKFAVSDMKPRDKWITFGNVWPPKKQPAPAAKELCWFRSEETGRWQVGLVVQLPGQPPQVPREYVTHWDRIERSGGGDPPNIKPFTTGPEWQFGEAVRVQVTGRGSIEGVWIGSPDHPMVGCSLGPAHECLRLTAPGKSIPKGGVRVTRLAAPHRLEKCDLDIVCSRKLPLRAAVLGALNHCGAAPFGVLRAAAASAPDTELDLDKHLGQQGLGHSPTLTITGPTVDQDPHGFRSTTAEEQLRANRLRQYPLFGTVPTDRKAKVIVRALSAARWGPVHRWPSYSRIKPKDSETVHVCMQTPGVVSDWEGAALAELRERKAMQAHARCLVPWPGDGAAPAKAAAALQQEQLAAVRAAAAVLSGGAPGVAVPYVDSDHLASIVQVLSQLLTEGKGAEPHYCAEFDLEPSAADDSAHGPGEAAGDVCCYTAWDVVVPARPHRPGRGFKVGDVAWIHLQGEAGWKRGRLLRVDAPGSTTMRAPMSYTAAVVAVGSKGLPSRQWRPPNLLLLRRLGAAPLRRCETELELDISSTSEVVWQLADRALLAAGSVVGVTPRVMLGDRVLDNATLVRALELPAEGAELRVEAATPPPAAELPLMDRGGPGAHSAEPHSPAMSLTATPMADQLRALAKARPWARKGLTREEIDRKILQRGAAARARIEARNYSAKCPRADLFFRKKKKKKEEEKKNCSAYGAPEDVTRRLERIQEKQREEKRARQERERAKELARGQRGRPLEPEEWKRLFARFEKDVLDRIKRRQYLLEKYDSLYKEEEESDAEE